MRYRDLETAGDLGQGGTNGHLVLSTLHTNDAPQTLTRLANMGIPPFNIASSVNLILAQRLARRLCEHCKTVEDVPHDALIEEGFTEDEIRAGITVYGPVGCDKLHQGLQGTRRYLRSDAGHRGDRQADHGERECDPDPRPGEIRRPAGSARLRTCQSQAGRDQPRRDQPSLGLNGRHHGHESSSSAGAQTRTGPGLCLEGTDQKGNRVKGESRARTIAGAYDLRRQGIMPLKVRKKSSSIFTNRKEEDHHQGHRDLLASAGDDDVGRRTHGAGLRYRGPRP